MTSATATFTASEFAVRKQWFDGYHSDCFLLHGEVTEVSPRESAWSKIKQQSADCQWITVRDKFGSVTTIAIFLDQDGDIADLFDTPVGTRIAVMAKNPQYGRRFKNCHRVTSVIRVEDLDSVRSKLADSQLGARALLAGVTKDELIEQWVRSMIDDSSHGWKFNQTPTSRAIPL